LKKHLTLKKPVSGLLGRKNFGECPVGLPRGRQNLGFFFTFFVPIQQGASLCAAVALIIFFYPVLDGIEKTELMIWQRIAMHPTE
jgi:hypothetical protein